MLKPPKRFYIKEDTPERARAREVARVVLRDIIRLLHPFMPFVTEELWSYVDDGESEHVVVGGWPQPDKQWLDPKLEADMQQVQAVISAIRMTRAEMKIPPGKKVQAIVRTERKRRRTPRVRQRADHVPSSARKSPRRTVGTEARPGFGGQRAACLSRRNCCRRC